jgi:hypothetical protein
VTATLSEVAMRSRTDRDSMTFSYQRVSQAVIGKLK